MIASFISSLNYAVIKYLLSVYCVPSTMNDVYTYIYSSPGLTLHTHTHTHTGSIVDIEDTIIHKVTQSLHFRS